MRMAPSSSNTVPPARLPARRRCNPVRPSSSIPCNAKAPRRLKRRRIRSLVLNRNRSTTRSLVLNRSRSTTRSLALNRSRNTTRNLVLNRSLSTIHSPSLRRPRIPLPPRILPLPLARTTVNTSRNKGFLA